MNAENFYKKHLVLGDVDLNKQTPLTHQGVIHIMDIYHQNQLMLSDVKEQSEQLCDYCRKPLDNTCCNDCLEEMDSYNH